MVFKRKDFPGGKPDASDEANILWQRVRESEPLLSKEELEEGRRLFYVGITRARKHLSLVVPNDDGLAKWINKAWYSTPKRSPIATRFVYESGWSGSRQVSDAIHNCTAEEKKADFSKFHQWYLRELQWLKV